MLEEKHKKNKKDDARKTTMSNVQSPRLPSSFPNGWEEGRKEKWR